MSIVDERTLDPFRADHLTAASIVRMLEQYVHLLLRLPVGVGKSFAACALLLCGEIYERFELIVYAAPSWDILREIIARIEASGFALPWAVIRPRPSERCGDLDPEWRELEASGCFALGKARLCRERCPERGACDWPDQFDRLKGVRLVIMTEQRLALVRPLVALLQARTGGRRTLVVLDEARILDTNFDVALDRWNLHRFREAVMCVKPRKRDWPSMRQSWITALDGLLATTQESFATGEFAFPSLGRFALPIQAWGWRRYGTQFRYVGNDLPLLHVSRPEERWIEGDAFHFVVRPYLHAHVLLLSAHVSSAYAGHRLGLGPIASPFEHVRFVHTGTRIINIRNNCGADRNFRANRERILDTFAVVIMRNVREGRTTLLISKKKSKKSCAKYLAARLADWGVHVRFVLDGDELPTHPDPHVIPIIHYGVLGVNSYAEYESCYCLNSYYIRGSELNRAVQEFEPKHFRGEIEVVTTPDRRREVRVQANDVTAAERAWLAEVYLRKLEVDPVIQAAGRVRFLTKPREVVFFQMNDLERELGPVYEVGSMAELREVLRVPSAREIDDAIDGQRAATLMAQGLTATEVSSRLQMSRATLFRRLAAVESLKKHKSIYLMNSETPPPFSGSPEGVSWS